MKSSTFSQHHVEVIQIVEALKSYISDSLDRTKNNRDIKSEVVLLIHRQNPGEFKVRIREEREGGSFSFIPNLCPGDRDDVTVSLNRAIVRLSDRVIPTILRAYSADTGISSFLLTLRFRNGDWSSYTVEYNASTH